MAFIQALSLTEGTSSATGSGITISAGNAVFVGIVLSGQFNSGSVSSVTDGLGNTYTRQAFAPPSGPGGGFVAEIWACLNITTGGAASFTVNNGGIGVVATWGAVMEFSNSGAGLDQTASNNSSTGQPNTGNLGGTTVQANEVEIAVAQVNNTTGTTITVDSFTPAYTNAGVNTPANDGSFGSVDWRILSATTNVGASWTRNGQSFDWAACAATFKISGAAPAFGMEFQSPKPQSFGDWPYDQINQSW